MFLQTVVGRESQIAARIAQNARILNRLPPEDRRHVLEAVDGRHLRVYLTTRLETLGKGYAEHDPYEALFVETLRAQLGTPWPVSVEITPVSQPRAAPGVRAPANALEAWLARHFYYIAPAAYNLVAQVERPDLLVLLIEHIDGHR